MKKPLFLVLLSLISVFAYSQSFRLGIFGGIANYQGDLVDQVYQQSKPAVGLTGTYQLTNRIGIRAGLTVAKLAGSDQYSQHDYLRMRNLSFETLLTEFSLMGEITPFDMDMKRWSPYLFGGLAIYHYDPYTLDQSGLKVFLQPLSTEGQGVAGYDLQPYARTQLALPFGGGIKYAISDRVHLGVEVGLRKLFTDYLDDISGNYADQADLLAARGQKAVDLAYRGDEVVGGDPVYPGKGEMRGSPKYKDYYYFSGLHLSFLLGNGEGSGRNGKNKLGCPTVF